MVYEGVQAGMRPLTLALLIVALSVPLGCRVFRSQEPAAQAAPAATPSAPAPARRSTEGRVASVICLFDAKPWLNTDVSGDRDPEGIQYRIFLNAGGNRGVAREGTLHIEMYQFGRDEKGAQTRALVSDWHYPTSQFSRVSASLLGIGYLVQLRWARKDMAGTEVEFVTQFEDLDGHVTRGATKRLRVPKYSP
jgi:hypothetical protein